MQFAVVFRMTSLVCYCVQMPYCCLQGIMLVYDVTKERTFTNVSKWLRNIEEVRFPLTDVTLQLLCVPDVQSVGCQA